MPEAPARVVVVRVCRRGALNRLGLRLDAAQRVANAAVDGVERPTRVSRGIGLESTEFVLREGIAHTAESRAGEHAIGRARGKSLRARFGEKAIGIVTVGHGIRAVHAVGTETKALVECPVIRSGYGA